MFAAARERLLRDLDDPRLSERVRTMAQAALTSLDAYERVRLSADTRLPTDPAGHVLVRPQRP